MNKVCLIIHVADVDGAFPIILGRLVFDKLDVFSCEIDEVDKVLEDALEKSLEYEKIYVVDLNISVVLADRIMNDKNLKEKVLVFDHHESKIGMNQYPFIQVVVENNGRKECGTTLFYQYLKEHYYKSIFDKTVVQELIELVRELDTYDFTEELKEKSFKLGALYSIYGRDRFIFHYSDYILENDVFSFSSLEQTLLEIEEERKNRYIEEKLLHVKKAVIHNIPVGIVFAERHRSELGHVMATSMQDIDIAIIINVDRSVSYRADKENVDVNVLAVPCGGGGHKHAGGSSLPENLQEKICELIFKEVRWIDCEIGVERKRIK